VSPWWPLAIGAGTFVVVLVIVLLVALVTDPSADDRSLPPTSLGPPPSSTSTVPAPTTTTTDPSVSTTPPVRPPAEVQVLVLNAAGVAGVAGRVTQQLTDAGYATIEPGNADLRSVSTVLVRAGSEQECEGVRQVVQPRFTGELPVGEIGDAPPLAAVDDADCVVLLGDDIAVTD
jgi:hypothetical protein